MWKLLRSLFGVRQRAAGESCLGCIYFDYCDPEATANPDGEVDGYCSHAFVTGDTSNEYGGHWTRSDSWCSDFKAGEPIWEPAEFAPTEPAIKGED